MSPTVNNFVHDLVAMAKAMEDLPICQSELEDAKRMISAQGDTIQRLELKLMQRANEIDTLKAQVRAAEVARDDAELRFLECDDAKSTLERALESLVGEARGVLAAVRPVPEPTPAPVAEEVKLVESPLSIPEATGSATDSSSTPTMDGGSSTDPLPHGATESASPMSETSSAEVGESVDPLPTSGANPMEAGYTNDAIPGQPSSVDATPIAEAAHSDGPFAPSSPTAPSPVAGEAASANANSPTPTQPDPEPVKHDDHGFIRHEWWMWHDRKLGLAV